MHSSSNNKHKFVILAMWKNARILKNLRRCSKIYHMTDNFLIDIYFLRWLLQLNLECPIYSTVIKYGTVCDSTQCFSDRVEMGGGVEGKCKQREFLSLSLSFLKATLYIMQSLTTSFITTIIAFIWIKSTLYHILDCISLKFMFHFKLW